jgi:4-coumarate--CoA ligase
MPQTILTSSLPTPPLPPRTTSLFHFFLPRNLDRPSDHAFVAADTGVSYTRQQFRTNALRLGAGIKKLSPSPSPSSPKGKGKKRLALVFSPNSIHYPLLFFALQSSLTIASLANASYTPKELCHQLRDGKPSILFVHPALWPTAKEALKILSGESAEAGWVGKIKVFYTVPKKEVPKESGGIKSFEDLYVDESEVKEWDGDALPEESGDDETAVLCYSSGTVSLLSFSCIFLRLVC